VKFGDRVRRLRKARGLTQLELAELLGVGRSYLSQIERGKRDPGLRMIKSISDGLGIPIFELLRSL
jgi:transcriptional regulator with XRE-family HTH domain